jgi:hypothetical protein
MTTQADVPKRRRGAQPGNQNRLVHGRRSRAVEAERKAGNALRKLALHVLLATGDTGGDRLRPRPMRMDQLALLAQHDVALLDAAVALGVAL